MCVCVCVRVYDDWREGVRATFYCLFSLSLPLTVFVSLSLSLSLSVCVRVCVCGVFLGANVVDLCIVRDGRTYCYERLEDPVNDISCEFFRYYALIVLGVLLCLLEVQLCQF